MGNKTEGAAWISVYMGEIQRRDGSWQGKNLLLIHKSISSVEKRTKKPTGELMVLAEHFSWKHTSVWIVFKKPLR